MGLIEQRHPVFGRLMALWDSGRRGEALPAANCLAQAELADLAEVTVLLTPAGQEPELRIAASGGAVDALYGAPLTGATAARLTPERHDAEVEARLVMSTGRPLLVEDEVKRAEVRHRVARLYLPLANDDGTPDGVLCGVVTVS